MSVHRFIVTIGLVTAAFVSVGLMPARSQALPQSAAMLWERWQERFVDATGRVIDNANGDISHSEGQGYGLWLAFLLL